MRPPHAQGRAARPLQVGLAALLIFALNLSVFATVFTNSSPISINDRTSATGAATPYPSNITVSGLGNVTDVNVTISNLNHTFPDDVDILLVGPNAATQKLILMSDVGGQNGVNNVTLKFDDSAAANLPDAGVIGSGSWKPTNVGTTDTFPSPAPGTPYSNPAPAGTATLASVFNGQTANGTWSLYVGDDAAGDVGIIADGWSLEITSDAGTGTFSNTAGIRINDNFGRALPYPSTIAVSGLTGTITDLNVTLTNMNHTFPQDVAVLLVGPKGQNLILMSQAVGDDLTPLSNTTLTFDDSAATLLPTTGGAPTGSYRPATYAIVDFPAPAPLSPPNYPTQGGGGTLATAFNGTDPNGTWSLYVVDVAPPDPGTIAGGWSLDITAGGTARRFTNSDFDGDGRSDVSIWNPTTHNWTIRDSSTRRYRTVFDWGNGSLGDRVVPGDYDGDGKTDIAIFRPSEGNWYIIRSTTGTPVIKNWGQSGDIPVQADYNGDGITDLAVYRGGTWYVQTSGGAGIPATGWGAASDTPVVGDYDGDGKADFAVFRSSENNWYIRNSGSGTATVRNWGDSGDSLVPADYDGDLKTDVAVWRPSNGSWYIIKSSDGSVQTRSWGAPGDTAIPGDYDGDNKADMAVWRGSEGSWYIILSGISGITPDNRLDNLGLNTTGDVPTEKGYIP